MRQAFAACVAFALLMVIVVVRCGFKDAPSAPPPVDAAIADAPIADAPVAVDAPPAPKKRPSKPTPKPTPKPAPPAPVATPTPVVPPPVAPPPVPARPGCTHPPNPTGCPAAEPNVNRPCDAEGVQCVYGPSCCPPKYVCNNGVFEAWFTHCE